MEPVFALRLILLLPILGAGLIGMLGLFYPPFTPVPDVEWSEVPYNLVWW